MTARRPLRMTLALQLVKALGDAWEAIRVRHTDVPSVVLLPSPASARGATLGHFSALRWATREQNGERIHEVAVTAEYLNRTAADVMETLLHEAAHAMNFTRGVKDCSASQYHNKRYREAALEVGLNCDQMPNYGWALTTLRAETRARYADEIAQLERTLLLRLGDAPRGRGTGSGSSRLLKATCACGFIIRASRTVLDAGVVRCDDCGELFAAEE